MVLYILCIYSCGNIFQAAKNDKKEVICAIYKDITRKIVCLLKDKAKYTYEQNEKNANDTFEKIKEDYIKKNKNKTNSDIYEKKLNNYIKNLQKKRNNDIQKYEKEREKKKDYAEKLFQKLDHKSSLEDIKQAIEKLISYMKNNNLPLPNREINEKHINIYNLIEGLQNMLFEKTNPKMYGQAKELKTTFESFASSYMDLKKSKEEFENIKKIIKNTDPNSIKAFKDLIDKKPEILSIQYIIPEQEDTAGTRNILNNEKMDLGNPTTTLLLEIIDAIEIIQNEKVVSAEDLKQKGSFAKFDEILSKKDKTQLYKLEIVIDKLLNSKSKKKAFKIFSTPNNEGWVPLNYLAEKNLVEYVIAVLSEGPMLLNKFPKVPKNISPALKSTLPVLNPLLQNSLMKPSKPKKEDEKEKGGYKLKESEIQNLLGFNLEYKDKNPLHNACSVGSNDSIKYLLKKKPEWLSKKDKDNNTPLHSIMSKKETFLKDDSDIISNIIETKAKDRSPLYSTYITEALNTRNNNNLLPVHKFIDLLKVYYLGPNISKGHPAIRALWLINHSKKLNIEGDKSTFIASLQKYLNSNEQKIIKGQHKESNYNPLIKEAQKIIKTIV